ncbi:MAG: PilZ domain-containing protein [Planctomycetota bacterium]|nr:PilZ domain-containing protein [Planctomycetota bacterium]
MAETRTKELRKSPRQKFSLPVQLVTRRNLEPIPFETLNISEGGVFIATDSPLPVSTEVTLVFFLSTLNANVRASGTVVRSNRTSTETEGPAGIAVELREYGRVGWHLLKRLLETQETSPSEEQE